MSKPGQEFQQISSPGLITMGFAIESDEPSIIAGGAGILGIFVDVIKQIIGRSRKLYHDTLEYFKIRVHLSMINGNDIAHPPSNNFSKFIDDNKMIVAASLSDIKMTKSQFPKIVISAEQIIRNKDE